MRRGRRNANSNAASQAPPSAARQSACLPPPAPARIAPAWRLPLRRAIRRGGFRAWGIANRPRAGRPHSRLTATPPAMAQARSAFCRVIGALLMIENWGRSRWGALDGWSVGRPAGRLEDRLAVGARDPTPKVPQPNGGLQPNTFATFENRRVRRGLLSAPVER